MKNNRLPTVRNLQVESLEHRIALTCDLQLSDWHNESNGSDVDANGYVTPLDALHVINMLNDAKVGAVTDVQESWCSEEPSAPQLTGGFLPDVNEDGNIGPLDALLVINKLPTGTDGTQGSVAVMPDPQGRPLSVVYTAPDGRTKEVELVEGSFSFIDWQDGGVSINSSRIPIVSAKPGAGILVTTAVNGDLDATVTRFMSDGTEVIERYVCVPGFDAGPDDVRRPIDGFESVLGALVTRQTMNVDGSVVAEQYEEATAERLLLITAELPSGESASVDIAASTTAVPSDLTIIGEDLLYILRQGYTPDGPMTLEELADTVDDLRTNDPG